MKKISWRNFVYESKHKKHNPLLHLFMIQTFAYGFFFALLPNSASVSETALYLSMVPVIGIPGVITWGILALTIMVAMTLAVFAKQYEIGRAGAFGGYILWIFGSVLMFSQGAILAFAAVAIPNILFWVWFYFQMNRLELINNIESRPRTDWGKDNE